MSTMRNDNDFNNFSVPLLTSRNYNSKIVVFSKVIGETSNFDYQTCVRNTGWHEIT